MIAKPLIIIILLNANFNAFLQEFSFLSQLPGVYKDSSELNIETKWPSDAQEFTRLILTCVHLVGFLGIRLNATRLRS